MISITTIYKCFSFNFFNKAYSKKLYKNYTIPGISETHIAFKLNIIDSVIDHGIQGWEHKVRPPSKRKEKERGRTKEKNKKNNN